MIHFDWCGDSETTAALLPMLRLKLSLVGMRVD
jgi:hypothetical protein